MSRENLYQKTLEKHSDRRITFDKG